MCSPRHPAAACQALPRLWGPSRTSPHTFPQPSRPRCSRPPCLPRGAGLPGAPRGPGCAPRCSWLPGAGGTPRLADSRAGRGAGGRAPELQDSRGQCASPCPGAVPTDSRGGPGSVPLWLLSLPRAPSGAAPLPRASQGVAGGWATGSGGCPSHWRSSWTRECCRVVSDPGGTEMRGSRGLVLLMRKGLWGPLDGPFPAPRSQ